MDVHICIELRLAIKILNKLNLFKLNIISMQSFCRILS